METNEFVHYFNYIIMDIPSRETIWW